jgi:two-component system sensor histidine kinase KdpD
MTPGDDDTGAPTVAAAAPTPETGGEPVAAAGRFRIYVGMAAGVGKTYAMLGEAARRAARGRDVVVGVVDTHDRPATAAQLAGLEVVPPKTVTYRGAQLAEMDLDAILRRRPELVLVDELAHSNIPGSGRHDKRWQDVLELLDANINVISTLNAQHIESLADVVERVTGTQVRERVPDAVLRQAEQLELVDSSPEQLRRRMLHGNIYPPEHVERALAGFFQTENLTALRELTLRFLADDTDEDLLANVRQATTTRTWETAERILVGVTGAPGSEAVLRRACRIASRTKAGLHVVCVCPGGSRSSGLAEMRQLTEDLGGVWMEIDDDDPARALMRVAAEQSATQIVLGSDNRTRRRWLQGRRSTVRRVTRLANAAGVDVHIIARPLAGHEVGEHPNRQPPLS